MGVLVLAKCMKATKPSLIFASNRLTHERLFAMYPFEMLCKLGLTFKSGCIGAIGFFTFIGTVGTMSSYVYAKLCGLPEPFCIVTSGYIAAVRSFLVVHIFRVLVKFIKSLKATFISAIRQ